ncbi:MAG: ribonuclease H-like YkuK family protein [Bacillota bacterium]|nr:hypothetical protein [Bacillota bacterium]HPZ54875.1 ribonuclease H-like YkuK family protein [Bacillota bacterium]HQD17674.1 ribonuclease H-like YkuK family protein [Bacillota bacterium]
MIFTSPTKGQLTFESMFQDIVGFISQHPEDHYRLIVGTDSQLRENACFVTAVVVHRVGKGGRYYYTKDTENVGESLKKRIFIEASRSLALASQLSDRLAEEGLNGIELEIHLDIGSRGDTRSIIKEVAGMVSGTGFPAYIKPNAYGASSVADRHTK